MSSYSFVTVRKSAPCPVCGKGDKCRVSPSHDRVEVTGCYRNPEHQGRSAFETKTDVIGECFYHRLIEKDDWKKGATRAGDLSTKAGQTPRPHDIIDSMAISDEVKAYRHKVYSRFLELIPLNDGHLADMEAWGIKPDAVRYGSLPGKAKLMRAMDILKKEFPDILNVPGFKVEYGNRITITADETDGLIVASLDVSGNIRRLIRRDPNPNATDRKWVPLSGGVSPSAGTPCHWARLPEKGQGVVVVEGERKADRVAAKLGSMGVVGVAGVGAWRAGNLIGELKRVKPAFVSVAYDADSASKPSVARSLIELVRALQVEGFRVEVWAWSMENGKGLDDLLLGCGDPEILQGEPMLHWLNDLAGKHGLDAEIGEGDKGNDPEVVSKPDHGITFTGVGELTPVPEKWLVPGLLVGNACQIIAGAPGSGKTSIVRAICCHLARGSGAMADPEGRPVKSCWAVMEDSRSTLTSAAIAEGLSTSEANRILISEPLEAKILDPKERLKIIEAMRHEGIGLLVVDTLAKTAGFKGISLNDGDGARSVLDPCAEIATSVPMTVLVLSHTVKSNEPQGQNRIAGSTQIAGAVRLAAVVDSAGPGVSLQQVKTNMQRPMDTWTFKQVGITADEARTSIEAGGWNIKEEEFNDLLLTFKRQDATRLLWDPSKAESIGGGQSQGDLLGTMPYRIAARFDKAAADLVSILRGNGNEMPWKRLTAEVQRLGSSRENAKTARDGLEGCGRIETYRESSGGPVVVRLVPDPDEQVEDLVSADAYSGGKI
jgi:hypothetical protein